MKLVKTVVREETQESRVVEAAGVLLVAEGIGELLHLYSVKVVLLEKQLKIAEIHTL